MIQFPYLLVFIFLFCLSFPKNANVCAVSAKTSFSTNSFYTFLMIYIIIFFIGGRWFVGFDCTNYEKAFDEAPVLFGLNRDTLEEYFKKCGMEKGFCIWQIFFKSFVNNFWCFSFLNAVIDYTIFYVCLNDYLSKYKGISILFFYVFIADSHLGINMIRNLKSVMLFLYSLRFLYKKQFLKYLLMNAFGFLFHISSLFYIPLYFVLNKKINKKIFIAVYGIGLIVFLFNIKWIGFALQPFATGNFGRITHLVLAYSDKANVLSGSGRITIGFLERFISFIMLMLYKDRMERSFRYGTIFVNMAFIYFVLFFFFNEMYIFIQRLPPLFLVSYCFIFPMEYSFLTKKQKTYFYICIFFYMILRVINGNSNEHYLYNNIFNPFKPDRLNRIKQILSVKMRVI